MKPFLAALQFFLIISLVPAAAASIPGPPQAHDVFDDSHEFARYGAPGSSRADAVFRTQNGATILDAKFGNAQMSQKQIQNYINNFQPRGGTVSYNVQIKFVRPN